MHQLTKVWSVTLEEDPYDPEGCILPFPPEVIEQVGWKEGDTLLWNVGEDGKIRISKKDDTIVP